MAPFGVRPAVQYQSSELATQRRPILRLPAIVLGSSAFCLWKSFRRSQTPFRDRPEAIRLHLRIGPHAARERSRGGSEPPAHRNAEGKAYVRQEGEERWAKHEAASCVHEDCAVSSVGRSPVS